ncbi:MAG: AFG1 family ATPase [Chromatiales bacterium]|nr:AFG1 family ATPase [Chromatiales bacterium]
MTPLEYYQQLLTEGDVIADSAQEKAVMALNDIYQRLDQKNQTPVTKKNGLFGKLLQKKRPTPNTRPEPGLYLWGGVGRGKTWLVDIFYNQLNSDRKLRLHFHHFMHQVHEEMTQLKGQANPLDLVAEKLAGDIEVLCLDEFIVTDIGDAMILAQLLRGLFQRGITLITTSNTEPDNLYQDGLQRASFLPAIDLLKEHTKVLKLDSDTDYRLRYLEQAVVYHNPHTPEVEAQLEEEFIHLAPEEGRIGGKIHIYNRDIPVIRVADDVVWFDFIALCGPPRSQADYLELARRYHTVLLSDIPILGASMDDQTRRLLYLIDEFYDRNVKLIISAAAQPESLYQGERLAFDFQRAISRLQEMQSTAYLAQEHRA